MEKSEKERPVFPGRKTRHRNFFDERGVSPVIAVILMVAITVVLAAALYAIISVILPDQEITPMHSVRFEEDMENPGKYIGEYQGSVSLDKIEIKVFDKSTDDTILLNPDTETYKEAPTGINITYKDINQNRDLDIADLLIIHGGDTGDKITVVYLPTGGSTAWAMLN